MPGYETLDIIADSYIPILFMFSFVSLLKTALLAHWRLFGVHAGIMSSGLLISYGLMFVDSHFQFWAMWGLDYSTHTAVALVMIVFLMVAGKRYLFVWFGSLVFYISLMLYQGYHSIEDIISTAIIVGLLLLPIVFLLSGSIRMQVSKLFNPSGEKDGCHG